MRREIILTRHLKQYDKDLFAKTAENGLTFIIRNKQRAKSFEFNGKVFTYFVNDPQMIMPLTNDLTDKGRPADWGIEAILAILKSMDGHRSDTVLKRIEKSLEKQCDDRSKSVNTAFEEHHDEFSHSFKKLFSDFNVSSMDQTDVRKKLEQKGKLI
jgi:hypothetical protein